MTEPAPTGPGARFDLGAVDREMRKESAYLREGHTARTLVREPDLRVVLVVMKAGARMAEHRADETASVQTLSGNIRLKLPDKTVDLPPRGLLVLEKGLRHDVEASEESAFCSPSGGRGDEVARGDRCPEPVAAGRAEPRRLIAGIRPDGRMPVTR